MNPSDRREKKNAGAGLIVLFPYIKTLHKSFAARPSEEGKQKKKNE